MSLKKFENRFEVSGRTSGSSFAGYLKQGIKFADLCQAFGESTYKPKDSGDGKVQYEWVFEFKGNVFTIYDWKTYNEEITINEYDRWHVGGKTNAAEFISTVEQLCQN
jgi:hypothetical protein